MTNVVKEVVPMEHRAKCATVGCEKKVHLQGHSKSTGKAEFRKVCSGCHGKAIAKAHGVPSLQHVLAKNAGFDSIKEHNLHIARENGFATYTEYTNSFHKYKKHRKTTCENVGGNGVWVNPKTKRRNKLGKIGCVCTATITEPCQLSVDHIDGNHDNNDPENLQTLCHNCHAIKTVRSEDNLKKAKKTLVYKQAKAFARLQKKKIFA